MNNTIRIPAGVIPQRVVRPLTPEQQEQVEAKRREAKRAEMDKLHQKYLARLAERATPESLAAQFAPVYKVKDVTPASVKPNNNGYDKENLGTVDWTAQDRKGKVASKNRLSARDARKASKK